MTTTADIAAVLETWAPPATAQSYDNVGLQIGRLDQPVTRVVVALELTHEVVEEAVREKAELVVTHHPLLFRPLKSLSEADPVGAMALRLAGTGISLYAAHTNLDAAQDGVSFALASAIGLKEIGFLTRLDDSLYKLVTFVPKGHADAVRTAIAAAGAGLIGNYDSCAFGVAGTGYFRAGRGAHPFVGEADGSVQSAEEIRLEAEVTRWMTRRVVDALKAAHPYEEVAYDLYPVRQQFTGAGLGAVGELDESESEEVFLKRVTRALDVPVLRVAGSPGASVRRVAVCGGAGSDLIGAARSAGAQAFVTADTTYHRFFEAFGSTGEGDLLVVDAGHYETEAVIEQVLADRLGEAFPDVRVRRTRVRTNPIRYFTA